MLQQDLPSLPHLPYVHVTERDVWGEREGGKIRRRRCGDRRGKEGVEIIGGRGKQQAQKERIQTYHLGVCITVDCNCLDLHLMACPHHLSQRSKVIMNHSTLHLLACKFKLDTIRLHREAKGLTLLATVGSNGLIS